MDNLHRPGPRPSVDPRRRRFDRGARRDSLDSPARVVVSLAIRRLVRLVGSGASRQDGPQGLASHDWRRGARVASLHRLCQSHSVLRR